MWSKIYSFFAKQGSMLNNPHRQAHHIGPHTTFPASRYLNLPLTKMKLHGHVALMIGTDVEGIPILTLYYKGNHLHISKGKQKDSEKKKKVSTDSSSLISFSTKLTAYLHSTYFPYVCLEMTNELLEFNDHTNRNNSTSYILSSLFLGTHVIILSTLSIVSTASIAKSNIACLTLNDSKIPSFGTNHEIS